MVDTGIVLPNNDVVSGKYRTERLAIGANATIGEMLPGALVERDTNDHDVEALDSSGATSVGWLGYGMAHSTYKPATRDTAYTALADEVPVHNGGGFLVRARCASTSFVKGTKVMAGTTGLVVAAVPATYEGVGTVAFTTSSAETVWILSSI